MPTLEQVRMQRAHALVTAQAQAINQWKTVAYAFGPQVQRNGFIATLAFLDRSSEVAQVTALKTALRTHLVAAGILANNVDANLTTAIGNVDVGTYMLATREALAWSVWVKRATQARG